ncbi:MAG: hypothetical protein EOM50_20775, partial [Erysipelotrichia bacterium]|nr:hypothetical protein [Erysipelotrichia bacterium]
MKKKILGIITAFVMVLSVCNLTSITAETTATGGESGAIQEGNVVYLRGNDAIIKADPNNANGAIVKTTVDNQKFYVTQDSNNPSHIYAGAETGNYGIVNITMEGGSVDYILGGNKLSGVVDTANIHIKGGNVGIVHGSSRSTSAGTLNDCTVNRTNNVNIVMDGGEAQALVPGSFSLTYVKNASVVLNGGTVAATTSPVQSGILGGTNGKVENLNIVVNGGTTKDIALAQRTMITGQATINVTGGSVGNVYAGSYYDDGDNYEGSKWEKWTIGNVNYGQAANIDINIGENVKYNDIYAGFQFLDKKNFIDKFGGYHYDGTANIDGSENIKANLTLAATPAKVKGQNEQHTVSMIDSKYANTNWLATGISLDKTSASLNVGQSIDLTATIAPANVTDKKVVWQTSNNKVVSVDENGKVSAVAPGSATITASVNGLKATCVVTVYKVEKPDVPVIDPTKPVEDVTVGVKDEVSKEVVEKTTTSVVDKIVNNEDAKNVSKETADKVKEALKDGKTITSEVVVETVKESKVDKTVLKAVKEEVKALSSDTKKVEVAQYLDLSVLLKANNSETLGSINVLDKPITFTVALPKELVKEGRVFYVIRVHEGVAEKLETTLNEDGTLSF